MIDGMVRALVDRPARALAIALVGLGLATLAFSRLSLETDITRMLDTPAGRTFAEASRAFALDARAHLLVEADRAGREADLRRFAAGLRERLLADPAGRFVAVESGVPLDPAAAITSLALPWGPLYWPPERLAELERRLSREGMTEQLHAQLRRLSLPAAGDLERFVELDPLELAAPLQGRVRSMQGSYDFAPDSLEYLSRDGTALLVTVLTRSPRSTPGGESALVGTLDGATQALLAEPWAAGLQVHAAGGLHLAAESERVIRGDLIGNGATSMVVSLLLLAALLRIRLDRTAVLFLPTMWGAGVGIGLCAALVPDMTVLALGTSPVLVGLGVDFTVHLLSEARLRSAAGQPPREAATGAARELALPLLVAALANATAFLAFLWTGQGFLREMGLLNGLGLLVTLAGTLLLLPPIMARVLARAPLVPTRDLGASRFTAWSADHPRPVLLVTGLLSVATVALVAWRPPRIEDDLREIHARDSAPLAAQARLEAELGGTFEPVLLLLQADDEEQVVAAAQRLDPELLRLVREGRLAARVSLAALLPAREDQERVRERLRRMDGPTLARDLDLALDAVGFDPEPFRAYRDRLAALPSVPPLTAARLREEGLGELLRDLVRTEPGGKASALVALYPRSDALDAPARAALDAALREALHRSGVEARPTGLYAIGAEETQQVARDFRDVSLITGLVVAALIFLRFRRPGLTLLTLLPAGLGVLWTAGLYSLLDLKLNMMNLGVLPMVLALSVDEGIMIVHRVLAGEPVRGPAFRATATAVVLTATTTIVGFAGLAFSENRGMASVGVLTGAGMAFSLLASLGVMPALLSWKKIGAPETTPGGATPTSDA